MAQQSGAPMYSNTTEMAEGESSVEDTLQFNTKEKAAIEKVEKKLGSIEGLMKDSHRLTTGESLKRQLNTLKKAADALHKAIDERVSQLSRELEKKHSQMQKQNSEYCNQLSKITSVLKECHQSCLKGCHLSASEVRTTVMEQTGNAAIQLTDKSLEKVQSYNPPQIVLNIGDLESLQCKVASMGSVAIDGQCTLSIDNFDYSVRTTVAKFDIEIESDKRPHVAKSKNEECRSVRLETVAIGDNNAMIRLEEEKKDDHPSLLNAFTAQQLADLQLDTMQWQLSGLATRGDNNASFIASNVALAEKSLFGIRFTPLNANNEPLIATHNANVYYFKTHSKTVPLMQMELGPNSNLRIDNKQTTIQITNTNKTRQWVNCRSIVSFESNAAFHCRIINGQNINQIMIGAVSHSANWNSTKHIGWFRKSISYYGHNGYLYHNMSCKVNGWPSYGTIDEIVCLVNYDTKTVSFFKNGNKVGSVANGIASDEPFHFGISLYNRNDCVSIRQCTDEETNALLRK